MRALEKNEQEILDNQDNDYLNPDKLRGTIHEDLTKNLSFIPEKFKEDLRTIAHIIDAFTFLPQECTNPKIIWFSPKNVIATGMLGEKWRVTADSDNGFTTSGSLDYYLSQTFPITINKTFMKTQQILEFIASVNTTRYNKAKQMIVDACNQVPRQNELEENDLLLLQNTQNQFRRK